MAEFTSMLTDIGRAKMVAAVALGESLQFTAMGVGDGNGNPITPVSAMSGLVHEVYRANLTNLTKDPENPNWLIVEMVIPSAEGGWTIHEVGIFDNLGDMVVIANLPPTYKPLVAEGSARELIIRVVVQMANPDVVELVIDPTVTLATHDWVEARIRSGVNPGELVRITENGGLPPVDGGLLTGIRKRNREYFYGQI